MKKLIDLTGTTIKIKKEHLKAIKVQLNDIDIALIMMVTGANKHKQSVEALWAVINKLYPVTKDYECSLQRSGEINIKYKHGDIRAMREDMKKRGSIV